MGSRRHDNTDWSIMGKNILSNVHVIFVILSTLTMVSASESPYGYRVLFYRGMPIDHFSFEREDGNSTFDMRYLINDTWWNRDGGPIFFYPGNEGLVTDFAQNTGIMWEWAPQFGAMLLFAEHRYYGQSLPYGNKSHEMPYLAHLSVDQTMSDYLVLLDWLKRTTPGAGQSPVIAFGGSYGAMLAAWMRLEYPHIVTGSVASSAPILQLPGGSAPCSSFASVATRTFANSGPGCDKAVKRTGQLFFNRSLTDEGRKWINDNYRLCNTSLLTPDENTLNDLLYVISDAWRYMALFDYPYPTNFLSPLPAWPVKEACKFLTDPSGKDDDDQFLLNVRDAALIFYNFSGQEQCLNLKPVQVGQFDITTWIFQSCTELTFRRCQNASDMFRPYKWDEKSYSQLCHRRYKVWPRYDWLTMNYGVERLKTATNIIFTSGDLDPWSGSSVTEESLAGSDPSLVVINIHNAAHHYDLRPTNPMDTPEVTEARNRMKRIIKGWIDNAPRVTAYPNKEHKIPTKDGKVEYQAA